MRTKYKNLLYIFFIIFIASCNKDNPVPALPADTSSPTLSYQFVSFASTIRFTPFGDSTATGVPFQGYEVLLADTGALSYCTSCCSGFVTSISPGANGGNDIAVIYKKNSIYSFLLFRRYESGCACKRLPGSRRTSFGKSE